MAKLEYTFPANENYPEQSKCIEVRVWGMAGREDQVYYIGSGVNFHANDNIWVEFCYSVQGAQVFYTRSSLHCVDGVADPETFKARLDEAQQKGNGEIIFGGGYIPGSFISYEIETKTYGKEGEDREKYTNHTLCFSFDTGVIFDRSSPVGTSKIEMKIPDVEPEDAARFMMDLCRQLNDTYHGKHPDPATTPPGRSEWPFIRQLNAPAYDLVSIDYNEDYFANPLLAEAFDGWLALLPPGGRVLDVGCGHGQPVISRLLEKGFQVAGTDFSPAMLAKAKENFPQLCFWNKTTSEIDFEGEFDGICSFNSTLYLDPIDFFHSIYRFYHALKPGGLLFLFGYDAHPGWRGEPYYTVVGHWMWSNTYSLEEACEAVKEHGYFEVLDARDVTTEEERAERLARRQAEVEKQRAEAEGRKKEWDEQKAADVDSSPEEPVQESTANVEEESEAADAYPDGFPEELKNFSADQALQILSSLPPVPDPDEALPYVYIIIARKKDRS